MAIRDEIRREQKKLKGQGPKAYLSYFWEYYKIPTLIVILCVIAAVSVIKTLVTHKKSAFGLLYMNAGYPSDEYEAALGKDLNELLGIDTSKEEVSLMLRESITAGGNYTPMDTASMSKIMAYVSAGELDTVIMDVMNYEHYLKTGMIADLRDFLSEEQIEALGDQVYYVDGAALSEYREKMQEEGYIEDTIDEAEATAMEQVGTYVRPDPSTMEDPLPAGIFMTGNKHLEDGEYPLFDNTECIFGFVGSSDKAALAAKCLEYFLN